jgi:hypothetical protein
MNSNPGISTVVSRAWDGTTAYAAEVRKFTDFGWSFEVIDTIAADAVFKVQGAPPSAGNPCVAGTFADVEAIPTCAGEALADGELQQIVIPAGTPVGTICSGTVPCRLAFARLASVSGDTDNVLAHFIRQGPFG